MGSVDKTLFLMRHDNDLLIVQIYMDDIIFGGSSHALNGKFVEEMNREFKMSLMGELQYFLGLQIKRNKEGTFIHHSKYTKDMLKKYNFGGDLKPQMTPMGTYEGSDKDEDGATVNEKEYRGMIGSLLYLMTTRPDI